MPKKERQRPAKPALQTYEHNLEIRGDTQSIYPSSALYTKKETSWSVKTLDGLQYTIQHINY